VYYEKSPLRAQLLESLTQTPQCQISEADTPSYLKAIALDNGRINKAPKLVVHATCLQDVVDSVRYAKAHNYILSVKAGGHSYAGYCLNDGGVVLDLSLMKGISFDDSPHTLVVEMGCTWLDVYEALEQRSPHLMAIGGTCLSVGVAGFILGGGYSFLSRSYGLGADSVASLTVVTADGEIQTISADSKESAHRELFWACLGGGGGNFGIIVSATLRLHALPTKTLLGGWLIFDIDQTNEVLPFYNEWVKQIPDALTVYGYIGRLPIASRPAESTLRLRLQPVFNGDYLEGMRLLEPLLQFKPIETRFLNIGFLDYLRVCDDCTGINGRKSYMRSGMLPEGALTAEVGALFQQFMKSAPSVDSFMLWMHQGGQTSKISSSATAYPHRNTSFIFEIVAVWKDVLHSQSNIEWAYSFAESLRHCFTGAFINYIDPLLTDWARMYYADNYEKLLSIKQKWDPDNFFRFQQSIGSPFEPLHGKVLDLTPL
jgi:hypothetical protein